MTGLEDLDTPDAWRSADRADQADELSVWVLSGARAATSRCVRPTRPKPKSRPTVGELSIVCDGQGRPRARRGHDHSDRTGRCSERMRLRRNRRSHTGVLASSTRGLLPKPPPAGRELAGSMPVVLECFERLVSGRRRRGSAGSLHRCRWPTLEMGSPERPLLPLSVRGRADESILNTRPCGAWCSLGARSTPEARAPGERGR